MKKRTNLMKRVLSFVMAFAMMLTLVPATALHARAATGGETLYFVPGDQWGSDSAWYAAYYFGAGEAWSALSDSNGDGYYETTVPDGGYTNVIFCRMNPASTALDWSNKWNQTEDLALTLGNCFTMANDTQWTTGNGTWSTRYSVSFDANGGAGEMASVTVDADSIYTLPECTFTAPAGKQFGMWVMGSDAYNPGKKITVIEDTVVSASWSDKTYTLTYDYNGGTDASGNSSSTDDFAEGAELTQASAPVPQREGDTLTGWTLKDGTTVTFPYIMPAEAVTFYAQWEQEGAEEPSEPTNPNTYEATFHFADVLGWGGVNLYTWTDAGTHCGSWPGTAVFKGDDGFYTMTVSFEAETNTGLKFIFNNGSAQTVNLALAASDFVDNKAEKWVVLTTTDSEGKYYADILDSGDSIAVSPLVNGTSVTFQYKNDSATSVEVRGSMNRWASGYNMIKNANGIWTATLSDLEPGSYEYKFVVDSEWLADPMNPGSGTDGNSSFLIQDPDAKDNNEVTINIYYTRADVIYQTTVDGAAAVWNAYVWGDSFDGMRKDFAADANGKMVTTLTVVGRETQYVNLKTRLSTAAKDWVKEENQVSVSLADIVSGTINVYVTSTGTGGNAGTTTADTVYESDLVKDNKVTNVQLDYDNGTVAVTALKPLTDPAAELKLVKDGVEIPVTIAASGTTYTMTMPEGVELDLVTLYRYKVTFDGYSYAIGIDSVYASDKFAEEYTYTTIDNTLGAAYTVASTTFKVWAPTAEAVSVKLYATGSDAEAGAADLDTYAMERGDKGVWTVTITGDQKNVYYTYAVTVDGETVEAVDPYARTTGVNGKRGMVIALDSTDPADGWSEITNKPESYTDAVIYELHVRDFSIDDSSGVKDEWQGKFLGLTQTGTTSTDGKTVTGLDYLKDLGITHLHLLPIYDYASVDETTCKTFNWGYDPQNYNTPEGSYSTNPYDGATRVKEMKEMVDTLHENGIGVIMDVVYNHVYNADTFCFNKIVPGYFSRVNSNTSGCGNDTASEREMVRKYIVESVLYWAEEYHIDGFRFDLVGLLDVQTIKQIVEEVHKVNRYVIFYGEGWDMDGTNREPGTDMAKQGNASKTPGFAYFSDSMRNGIGGSNGTSKGFASGAGNGTSMVSEWLGKPWWTSNPQQVVQYASCHDNYTLIDKLILSTSASGITDDIISMNNLAAAYYMTSQGIAFIHAGEEMLREKLEKNGDRCENSYNASDYVNHIEWSNLEKEDYADTSAYYQGLIEFRKAHPALRYDTAAKVSANVKNTYSSANVLAFQIDGNAARDDDIYVIFNAGSSATTVTLPTGEWTININKKNAGTESLGTATGSVRVDGISAMVLTKADEGKDSESSSGKVTVYFTNNKNWSNVYAYAWEGTTYPLGAWPGSTMTFVETNEYGQAVYCIEVSASAEGISFNNNDGAQTVDLTVPADGMGYYCLDTTSSDGKLECESYKFRDPISGSIGEADEYFLFGWINNADYAQDGYKFKNGTLTATFKTDSYVYVVNGDYSEKYMTKGWLGNVTSATLYDVAGQTDLSAYDKLIVPGGVEVTFTLTVNDDDTVTLSYVAKEDSESYSANDTSGIQDGVTLHCWNWSFAEIKANMAKIAEQGYTAIQTSPVQPLKETTSNVSAEKWWLYYQPVDFKITTAEGNALGTKTELVRMIETAHQYGIKVIVDVVANHLANETDNNLSEAIPEKIRTNTAYWHDITTNISDWSDRKNMTQYCMDGLPDLNTKNDEVQTMVLNFLKECIDAGVDGFRFDAAKSIETPEDDSSFASYFWPTVIGGAEKYAKSKGKDIYCYGETLDSWNGLPVSAYTKYMAITDNTWSDTLRENISGGTAAMSPGYDKAAAASQLVLWAESHDTYANDNGKSNDENEVKINKTWALVAARADAMGLYFARPERLTQALGVASVTGWANAEVKAVNKFHNFFAGQSEYIDTEDGIVYVERGTSGVVLVNAAGTNANVSVTANTIADGTYIDQITGNTFTVADGKITGSIGSTGIAVVYKIDLKGATMTLGNSLAMNFVIDTAELTGTNNYAVITKKYADGTKGKSVTINQADWKVYDGTMYYFTYSKVAAKEMTDKITVVVYNSAGEAVTNSWTDSVRDYCMRAIKAEEKGNNNPDKLALYVDMLNYGAAAQNEFDYYSDDLATSRLTEAQKGYATGDVNAKDHRGMGKGYLGSTLTLGNEIQLNFIFDRNTVTQDMHAIATYTNHYGKEKTVTIKGSAFGKYNKDNVNGWYIPVADMSVADGCQVNGESKFMVTCTVYNADGTVVTSAQDSVASYVARANADTNNTNPLYTLILKFATSAYNYFH